MAAGPGSRFCHDRARRFGLSDCSSLHRRKSSVQFGNRLRNCFVQPVRRNVRNSYRSFRRDRLFRCFLARHFDALRQSRDVEFARRVRFGDGGLHALSYLSSGVCYRSLLPVLSYFRRYNAFTSGSFSFFEIFAPPIN